jgi:hypothetical protein
MIDLQILMRVVENVYFFFNINIISNILYRYKYMIIEIKKVAKKPNFLNILVSVCIIGLYCVEF